MPPPLHQIIFSIDENWTIIPRNTFLVNRLFLIYLFHIYFPLFLKNKSLFQIRYIRITNTTHAISNAVQRKKWKIDKAEYCSSAHDFEHLAFFMQL